MSNVAAYEPHPATLGYRIIEFLKSKPAGTRIASGPLAEAMGQRSSAIFNALERPVQAGLVVREKVNGLFYWSLGDGVALPVPDDDEPPRRTRGGFPGVDMDASTPRKPAPPADDEPFSFQYSSSGEIQVRKGGSAVEMTPAEYAKLTRFIGAIRDLPL